MAAGAIAVAPQTNERDTIMDAFDYVMNNPVLAGAAALVAGGVWRVIKAWLDALERHANQQWIDHGEDDDQDIKVTRVTDKVQANSIMMSMLPRVVVENRVRKVRVSSSTPPPKPTKPKEPSN